MSYPNPNMGKSNMLFLIIVSFEETSLNLTVIFDLAFIHLELLKTDSINGNICLTLLMFLLLFPWKDQ
jgi:hypothetical protein